MSSFIDTINNIKDGNIDDFEKIILKMKPTLKKYTNYMFKEEKEDTYAELTLALWESVVKIDYYNTEGEIVNFLHTAIRNRFYELYRKSRKKLIMSS